jgi:hypothetical protein
MGEGQGFRDNSAKASVIKTVMMRGGAQKMSKNLILWTACCCQKEFNFMIGLTFQTFLTETVWDHFYKHCQVTMAV